VLYDLARFEVLRGPQGTLFGAGSESGTLRSSRRRPGSASSRAMSRQPATPDHRDGGGSLRGMVNCRCTVAALRSVLYKDHRRGSSMRCSPTAGSQERQFGRREGGRIALLWEAHGRLSWSALVFRDLDGGYPRVDLYNILATPTRHPAGGNPGDRQQFTQQQEGIEDLFTGALRSITTWAAWP